MTVCDVKGLLLTAALQSVLASFSVLLWFDAGNDGSG